jgi:hypothetical protein
VDTSIDIRKARKTPGEILDEGGSWSDYNARYEAEVSKAYVDAEHRKQADAEAARRAAVDAAYERQRQEELNWSPVQLGLSIHCPSCAAAIFISGTWADGTDSTNPDQSHCWRESYENHVVLTTPPCSGCGRRALCDLGKMSHEAPRTYSSLMTMKSVFGFVASAAMPKPSEEERKPGGFFWRLLGPEE